MSITVYGASDDTICIDGDISEEFPWTAPGYGQPTGDLLAFSDGTILRIRFDDAGVWRITPVVEGAGRLVIGQATEDQYTDRAHLDGATWVVHGIGMAKR